MSDDLALLAARKELLLARSRLHRLELRRQAGALRESVLRPQTALAIVASAPVRPLLLGVLLLALGRGRLSRLASAAAGALALIQAARALLRTDPPGDSQAQ